MRNVTLLIIIVFAFGFTSQGQNKIFKQEEKRATEFMQSKITEIYNEQFKTEFIGTWHEFGKIYGFKFYIIENKDYPITVEYNLSKQDSFEFDKQAFEKEFNEIKLKIQASKQLEKELLTYFPNARAIADRIENSDGTYRWVYNIYTAWPLDEEKGRTFQELKALCYSEVKKLSEKEAFYNFHFPSEIDQSEYTDSRFSFFAFDNFSNKYTYHYRVDFIKTGEQIELTNQKLYNNLNEKESEILRASIRKWKNENGFENWEISLLTESTIDRDLNFKKIMLSLNGQKKFGFIHLETKELKFIE